jgi:hypothetical protein
MMYHSKDSTLVDSGRAHKRLTSPAKQLGVDGTLLLGALHANACHSAALVKL